MERSHTHWYLQRPGGYFGVIWLHGEEVSGVVLAWLTPRDRVGSGWLITRLVLGCLPNPGPKYCNHTLIMNTDPQTYLMCCQVKC